MGVTFDYLLIEYPHEWTGRNSLFEKNGTIHKWIYYGNTKEEMEESIMKFGSIEEQAEYKMNLLYGPY